jgi:TonB family protein
VHSEPAASSLSPEAQRFETAKHLRQRALTILSLRAAEDTADKVWQEWHPPANGKLLITKVRLTLDADGKMSACKVVASSGSEPEDKSVQDCLSGTTFKPLPVGITSLDLFWTLMSDGTMNMVESTDSPEADAYNRNLIGGIFRPAGINAPVYGLSNTGVSSRAIGVQADVDFGPYMADLQRRIKRAWFPPKGSESKRVIVVFKVHKGGELSNLRLDKSSAVAVADQAGLEAVQRASPFRPLPAGASDSVGIQFTFDYNVFNGGGHGTFISY